LLLGGVGLVAALFVVCFPIVFCFIVANYRLGPPSVRGLAAGEEPPRYLELVIESARRRFEELGFRRAGYLAIQSIFEAEPEIVQLVMRNDETRTLAYFYVSTPFTAERPSAVAFESFLPDGTVFATTARFAPIIGPELPNRRRSAAADDQGIYRDHLAALVRAGLAPIELPDTFQGLLALNVNDTAWIWRNRLDHGVVVGAPAGGFRFTRWAALTSLPKFLYSQLASKLIEARRRGSNREQGPVVDANAPEIRQFVEERTRRRKAAAQEAASKPGMSRTKTALLWLTMVVSFAVFWHLLGHQRHAPSQRIPAWSETPPLAPADGR
jgi:hypothetical protein